MAFRNAFFGHGSGPIFLDHLNCIGLEANLLQCQATRPTGLHACSHNEDAGVRCIGMSNNYTCKLFVFLIVLCAGTKLMVIIIPFSHTLFWNSLPPTVSQALRTLVFKRLIEFYV